MNRVCLIGRLTKDLELRATPSGANVTSFTLAVDNIGKDAGASFIECVAWNQQATFLTTYCKKGTKLAVEGRLQTRSYDRKDGTKAYVTEVIADRVENLSPKEQTQETPNNDYASNNNIPQSYDDSDLPF